jgi:alpha-1,2-mannosyltransferase
MVNVRNLSSKLSTSHYIAALREAHWLTEDRAIASSRVLLVLLIGFVAIIPWAAPTMNVGHDFAAFWTSARFALDGRAGDAYGEPERAALAALFGPGQYPPFFYPPPALFLWLPLARMPFAMALAIWVTATGAAYATAISSILKRGSIIPAIAFPAVAVCALFGQNSLFSAALLGGSAVTLDRYPVVAGVLIGVLVYKPQLAFLAPLVLISARRWRAFAAASATTLLLIAGATVVFGIDSWTGFIGVLPDAGAWNIGGAPGFDKFASPYAAIRLLGGASNLAWLVQLVTAAGAITTLVFTSWRRPGGAAEIALLVATTGLSVPFFGNYDMVIFAVPGAWLISEAVKNGWLPYERAVLAALYVTPIIMMPAASNGVPLAPIAEVALIILVVRRIRYLPGIVTTSFERRAHPVKAYGRSAEFVVDDIHQPLAQPEVTLPPSISNTARQLRCAHCRHVQETLQPPRGSSAHTVVQKV